MISSPSESFSVLFSMLLGLARNQGKDPEKRKMRGVGWRSGVGRRRIPGAIQPQI
jgi:hypothetical protein